MWITWEHIGRKTKNLFPKTGPILSECWAFGLAAWNFYFHNRLSPFLARANGKGHKMGDIVCVMVLFHSPFGQSKFKMKIPKCSTKFLKKWTHIALEECWWTFLKMWDLMNFALLTWRPDSFPSLPHGGSQYNWDLIGIRGSYCQF